MLKQVLVPTVWKESAEYFYAECEHVTFHKTFYLFTYMRLILIFCLYFFKTTLKFSFRTVTRSESTLDLVNLKSLMIVQKVLAIFYKSLYS